MSGGGSVAGGGLRGARVEQCDGRGRWERQRARGEDRRGRLRSAAPRPFRTRVAVVSGNGSDEIVIPGSSVGWIGVVVGVTIGVLAGVVVSVGVVMPGGTATGVWVGVTVGCRRGRRGSRRRRG